MKVKRTVQALCGAAIVYSYQSISVAQEITVTITPDVIADEVSSLATPEGYWTPKRAREATPIPWYDEEADLGVVTSEGKPAVGPPFIVPSGSSDKDRESVSPIQVPNETVSGVDFNVDFGTQNVGDNTFLNKDTTLQKKVPWRAIGKLLITNPSGGSGSCSASVISPNDVIVTAAHCCYDRAAGAFNSNWTFAPARRDVSNPYGLFAWSSTTVLTAWINSGGRNNDVCVIKLNPRSDGKRVSSLVGWLGRSWNFGTVQHHFAFGYPGNIESGKFKYECTAESYANCGNSSVLAMGCNMTFGSSGGPWIRVFKKFESGAVNFVNSVVSGYDSCTGTFGQSFNGARFTSSNIVPLCSAAGC